MVTLWMVLVDWLRPGGHRPSGRVFFGIVHKGRLYFTTNATTASPYREREMKPFRPSAKQTLNTYYEIPLDVLEDAGELTIWAQQASNL